MERPENWRVAWITGASSGLGLELAQRLAAMGVKVAATARSAEKLDAIAAVQPNIVAFPGDVTDLEAMRGCVGDIESRLGPIDLAIFSAGIFRIGSARDLAPEIYREAFAINVTGALNSFFALRDKMIARRSGHIAFISSIAGYRGLTNQSAYGPTKAALINFAEAVKLDLEPDGIDVTVVNPGFIATPMTEDNPRPMPYIVTVDDAAERILEGLRNRQFEIVFPYAMKFYMKLLRRTPYAIYFWIARMIEARQQAGQEAKAGGEE